MKVCAVVYCVERVRSRVMCWTGQAIVLSEDLEFVAQQLNLPLFQDTQPLDPIVKTDDISFDHVLVCIN